MHQALRMTLLVGLGNPGPRYAGHRHNIGYLAADAIARAHRFPPFRARFEGHFAEGTLAGARTLILKPHTYMNESGRAVGAAMRFFKLAASDVIVLYDELDLPLGKLRVKQGGGTAGHNGVRSIAAHIGADFWRVRLGIGHPGERARVLGHVLGAFTKEEQPLVAALTEAIADAAPYLARFEMDRFMNRVSVLMRQEPEPREPPHAPGRDA
jgi:PTH1 family peptidyl-tRNA hydrolase